VLTGEIVTPHVGLPCANRLRPIKGDDLHPALSILSVTLGILRG
jgi:hypothetical protein